LKEAYLLTNLSIFFKALFLVWLWIESSTFVLRKISDGLLKRLLQQGTLDGLFLFGMLSYFIPDPNFQYYLRILFIPFLILDALLPQLDTKIKVFFWVEIVVVFALVKSGLVISFIGNPSGGYYFFGDSSVFISFFWFIFFVSLINLLNLIEGLLFGMTSVLCMTFLVGLFLQSTINPTALPFAIVLTAFSILLWSFTLFRVKKGLTSPILSSIIAILVGMLSIIATSKKLALISISITLGIFLIPIVFFSFIIYFTHFLYKLKPTEFAEQPQVLWRFTTRTVNAFALVATITLNVIISVIVLHPSKLWSVAIFCFCFLIFIRITQLIFIKNYKKCKDIIFPLEDFIIMFGVKIFRGRKKRALEIVDQCLSQPFTKMHHLVTPDALCLYKTVHDQYFKDIFQKALMAIPDGAGVLWASIFLCERPILQRIPGIEFSKDLFQLSQEKSYQIYFLGAKDETLNKACEKIQSEFPDLNIIGRRNGYFTPEEEDAIIDNINQLEVDILFVALGVPLQEYFIDRNRDKLKVKLCVGIGGSLDVMSGNLKRSPKFFQDYGLEWLYRTLKEPWRITRILGLPLFILYILKQKLKQGDKETLALHEITNLNQGYQNYEN
jgi:N-acetylglucosaminyldiphosphoundecaprenol N-acetyl-beta-D-mannosaminyltransferase